jgi:hypothetical protein
VTPDELIAEGEALVKRCFAPIRVLKTLRDAEPCFTVWHSPMSRGNRAGIHFS